MSWDKKQDDLYKQNEDGFWNKTEDAYWDSDERYVRKDECWQEPKQPSGMNTYQNQQWKQNWNQNPYQPYQTQAQAQQQKADEYKRNSRIFVRIAILCAAVVTVAILFSVVYVQTTRKMMEQKIKELNYTTQTYQSKELLTINDCDVIVSDAYIIYDSTEVWMPSDKMLIGIYVEATASEEYVYDAGIQDPYLKYGDGHYTYPITDSKLESLLMKMGFKEEEFLPGYKIGDYGEDAGYYFFLVDEDAEKFAFVIEERESNKGRVEYLKARHLIELELEGY